MYVGCTRTRLALAIAEFGRIDKTLHTLTYIDDKAKRRGTLTMRPSGQRSPVSEEKMSNESTPRVLHTSVDGASRAAWRPTTSMGMTGVHRADS